MPKSKNKTKAERAYHDVVANIPCVLCEVLGQDQEGPTCVHHIRSGQGMSQRAGHFLVVALCYECHQGDNGIHGNQSLLRIGKVEELDLLGMTIERAQKQVKRFG